MGILKKCKRSLRYFAFVITLLMILPQVFSVNAQQAQDGTLMLQPGGMCFGVQMKTEGALVVGFSKVH